MYVHMIPLEGRPQGATIGYKGLGHVNEMGTLYGALAGLMNLVAILDALHPSHRREEMRRRWNAGV